MSNAFENYNHLPLFQVQAFISQINVKMAVNNHKHFVGIGVLMPDKFSFYAHQFEMAGIHQGLPTSPVGRRGEDTAGNLPGTRSAGCPDIRLHPIT